MKLIRYSDRNEWESIFGDSFRAFAPLLRAAHTPRATATSRPDYAGAAWFEDAANYYARVDVPGVKRENLHLDVEDGFLRLRHEQEKTGDGAVVSSSRFEQVLRCPDGIRADAIEARLSDGVLELTLPKEESRKPVSITIN